MGREVFVLHVSHTHHGRRAGLCATCLSPGRKGWSMRNMPLTPMGGAWSMRNMPLTPMGGEPGLCATGPFHPWEESLVYAQQDCLTHGRRAWSMRRVFLTHGRRAWSMRRVSLILRRRSWSMRRVSPHPKVRAWSMRRGLSLRYIPVYAQRPLFLR